MFGPGLKPTLAFNSEDNAKWGALRGAKMEYGPCMKFDTADQQRHLRDQTETCSGTFSSRSSEDMHSPVLFDIAPHSLPGHSDSSTP